MSSSKRCVAVKNGHPETYSTIDSLPERVRTIAVLRGLGYTFSEIGRQFDVTPQAVSLMLFRYRRVLKSLEGTTELHSLSPRAVNALARHGIRSREQAQHADLSELLRFERNCGAKTRDEIARWIADGDSMDHKGSAFETAILQNDPEANGSDPAALKQEI